MKERPIPFSTPMVRAILSGTKTQTRRVVKPQPANGWDFETPAALGRITSPHPKKGRFGAFLRRGVGTDFPEFDLIPCPYGMPGDRLWVRESYRFLDTFDSDSATRVAERCLDAGYKTPWAPIQYEADRTRRDWQHVGTPPHDGPPLVGKLRPNIFMPHWASRILLNVTGVRVERLQDISEADAIAEGIERSGECNWCDYLDYGYNDFTNARRSYRSLWESLNGPSSWDANPWVWVVEFKPVRLGIIKE